MELLYSGDRQKSISHLMKKRVGSLIFFFPFFTQIVSVGNIIEIERKGSIVTLLVHWKFTVNLKKGLAANNMHIK